MRMFAGFMRMFSDFMVIQKTNGLVVALYLLCKFSLW